MTVSSSSSNINNINNSFRKAYNLHNLRDEPANRSTRHYVENNVLASTVRITDTQMFSPRHRDALGNPLSSVDNNNGNKEKRKISSANPWNRNTNSAQSNTVITTAIIPKVDGTFVLSPRASKTRLGTNNTSNKYNERHR